ncbi:multidrug resistance-associated protein 1-like [Euwallacea fornicatus]|uniref:multidrug resistance-associated protein 1-like n=1 Tax=Euwallacea fornicatus TaxID=995702 RepID=UPI00338E84EA
MSNESWLDTKALDKFCGSKFWNSTLTWNTDDPEFTPCFEKTVLVWIPCQFLWLFSPLQIYFQVSSPNKYIPWNWKNFLKLLINALICAVALSDFITSAGGDVNTKVDIFIPLLKFITFGLAIILAYKNKNYGVQSSGVLFQFWLLCALCGIPQLRSEIRMAQNNAIKDYYEYLSYLMYYPLVLAMLLLNCFAEGIPKVYPYGKTQNPSPEPRSSFLSRATFCFLEPFMYKGFKRPLEMKDMYDLEYQHTSGALVPIFEQKFSKRMQKHKEIYQAKIDARSPNATIKKRKDTSILPALWGCLWRPFVFGLCMRLMTDVIQFANPKLLGFIISYIGSDEPLWKGILYAFIMFLVATFITFVNSVQMDRFFVVGLHSRTILTAAIYRKSLRISNSARKNKTVGEIVNLMSNDAQKFQELIMFINTLWSAPVSIILALVFLYQELGMAVFAGLLVMLALIPINSLIVKKSRNFHVNQMKNKDERVKVMNEVLGGIKVLKLYAWEKSFEKKVMNIRDKEVKTLKAAAYLNAGSQFLWNCTPFIVSCGTFATYVLIDEKNILDPAKAFVSLALLNLLRMPMSMLPHVIMQVVHAWVSIKRINSFLNADELEPYVTHNENKAEPITIKNGTFTWGEEPILKNINLTVASNSLTAVVGTVGTGKSSLISAISGEMDIVDGKVNTWGSVAYVPQQAWIQNATVQDNITFGAPLNKLKYQQIVDACALRPDFEMLANGDQTEIGEKGINLSGGQKQRISLARAVYADAELYLLDDPLSAVDSHVGKHIFDNLIGPNGLLKNKTRLLVTHSITYLPQTDKIICLKEGSISETGSYKELLSNKGAFAEFIMQHITEEVEDEDELDELQQQLEDTPIAPEIKRTISRQRSRISESASIGSQHGINGLGRTESRESLRSVKSSKRRPSMAMRKISTARKSSIKPDTEGKETLERKRPSPKGKLITEERTERGNVKKDVYIYYLKAIGFIFIFGTVIFSISFQLFGIFTNVWLGWWSEDPNMIVDGKVDTALRDKYLGVYGALGLAQAISVLSSSLIFAKGTMRAATILHNFMLKNVLRMPMSFFDTTPSGRILSRFSGDIISIDMRLPMAFNIFFQNTFRVLGTIGVICFTTPLFTAVIVPLLIIYIFIQRYYVASTRQLRRMESVSRSPIYSHFGETLTGTHVIRAYNQVQRFTVVSEDKVDINQKITYPTNWCSRWLSIRLETIGNLIILFAALFAVLAKDLNPALVGLSVTYSMNITNTLNFLVRMISDVETTIVSVERIKEYGEKEREAPWEIPSKTPAITWPETGIVEFKEYSVRYRPGLDPVLKGISFNIKGGEKVGIVGRTGAGKSSLTLGLFRIIEAAKGEIVIDGKNISELGLHDVRSRLTIIPQDAVLFSGSLRMNLDPFEKYSDEEVWTALEMAHLKNFANALASGLYYNVSEGGENLSVGQRQLVCLARALLRKTKILILDEATAAVDLETDELIQKTIHTAFAECTVLTIAHRLNTIIDSDRVLVLNMGEIAEFDSPEILLKNKKSIFFGMCKDAGLAH